MGSLEKFCKFWQKKTKIFWFIRKDLNSKSFIKINLSNLEKLEKY